jgi:integrase
MKPSRQNVQPQVSWKHASLEEYTAFVSTYARTPGSQDYLLRSYRRFVKQYPDLLEWFQAPLPQRIGRLLAEDAEQIRFPVSSYARPYLMFLGVRGYVLFDWDWLLTVPQLDIGSLLVYENLALGMDKLVESAVRLGYTWKPQHIESSFNWSVWRMFMHSRIHHVDEITDDHVTELCQAIHSLEQRVDVTLFFGSTTHHQKIVVQRRRCLYRLHMVLYHRGQVATYPNIERRGEARPVLNPTLEQVVRRYLAERSLSARPGTVKNFETTLRKLVAWLAFAHPEIHVWAQVTRDHVLEFAEALHGMVDPKTKQPLSLPYKQKVLGRLVVFFQDLAFSGWEHVPERPLLGHGDLPQLPIRVPRYIPEPELERLMPAIRSLECPFQRAALLIARWSGARRNEICDLSLDCLDAYPDGTPRLRIPIGKPNKERLIPIHEEAACAIRHLQQLHHGQRGLPDGRTGVTTRYLFMHRGTRFSARYLLDDALQKVCEQVGLLTAEGKPMIWPHRFRHTLATQLARRGARFQTIQKILGHEGPEMSIVYIGLTDEEVRQDYQSILAPDAVVAGPGVRLIRSGELAQPEVYWLKANFFKTELELGRCLRLPQEGPCECDLYLTCAKFVTTPEYAPRLRRRRRIEQELVQDAHQHGWQREVERHQCTIRRLEALLLDSGEPIDGPEASS